MAKSHSKSQKFGKSSHISTSSTSWNFPLRSFNYKILGIGALVIVIAYGLMATAISDDPNQWNNVFAVSVAPILLTIGYCVIIPYGLLVRSKNKEQESAG